MRLFLSSPYLCLRHHAGGFPTVKMNLASGSGVGIQYRKKSGWDESAKCCKDVVSQDEKRICDCPKDVVPPNYDTYRIKVPNIIVPPLPPSNAKPMLDCTKTKGPCSVQPPPLDPPCPPPPKKPFPWIYVWSTALFMTLMGVIYKLYLIWDAKRRDVGNKPIWRPRAVLKRPPNASDLPPCVQYLLIGGGAASFAAYEAIKKYDKRAKVFFITNEDSAPYKRPPISREMWFNAEPPKLDSLVYYENDSRKSMYFMKCTEFLDPVTFYRKKRGPAVSLATGWCVTRVDPENHVAYVKTLNGEVPIYYERCLLAPGARPKNLEVFKTAPKAVREKTIRLRTIRDLEIAFRKVREAKHVTVIGAGPLGSEVAWYLGKTNDPHVVDKTTFENPDPPPPTEFVLVYKDKGLMAGIFPEYLGEWLAERLRCVGVKTIPQTQVYDAFTTPDNRLELTLSNGTSLKTDFVIVAVGVDPRTEIAEASDLEVDRVNGGIVVNTEMRARHHLYCAGDAASYYSQWKNIRLRAPHFDNAITAGDIAGKNMTGFWETNNMEPHFWFALGPEVQIEVVGEVGACMPTVGLWKECADDEAQKEERRKEKEKFNNDLPCYKDDEYAARYKRGLLFYLRDETVVGMALWNIPPIEDRREVIEELLRAKPSYKDINLLANILGFPETQCSYFAEEVRRASEGPCYTNLKKW